MEKEYKILDIRDGSHGKFGSVIMVKANPIITNAMGMKYHTSHMCSETDSFLFPCDSSEIDEVLAIARSGRLWCPDEDDYTIERIKDRATGKSMQFYCHDSLYDYDGDSDDMDDFCSMTYHCREYSINHGEFIDLPNEQDWDFDNESISTPYGVLYLKSFMEVNQGPLSGVQFSVYGELDFSSLDNALDSVNIETVAVMRQPYNVWLWIYMFDEDGNNIINFCGNDDLDGFMEYMTALKSL